jgi:hypothetical protein
VTVPSSELTATALLESNESDTDAVAEPPLLADALPAADASAFEFTFTFAWFAPVAEAPAPPVLVTVFCAMAGRVSPKPRQIADTSNVLLITFSQQNNCPLFTECLSAGESSNIHAGYGRSPCFVVLLIIINTLLILFHAGRLPVWGNESEMWISCVTGIRTIAG